MKRKQFLKAGAAGLSGLIATPLSAQPVWQSQNHIDVETIREFVAAGHNDLKKVKAMLREEPNLLNCRYDWGGGDFEEAIEGAGHLGNKDIANFLIEKCARPNLFVFTMLGKKKIVLPALEAYPELIRAKGPHGFSLLHHARVGGDGSSDILDYLLGKGLDQTKFDIN